MTTLTAEHKSFRLHIRTASGVSSFGKMSVNITLLASTGAINPLLS
jgi:hypothetical protein